MSDPANGVRAAAPVQIVPPAATVTVRGEPEAVACPYCATGRALVIIDRYSDGTVQINEIRAPRKCEGCGSYFLIRPQLVLVGAKLEAVHAEKRDQRRRQGAPQTP